MHPSAWRAACCGSRAATYGRECLDSRFHINIAQVPVRHATKQGSRPWPHENTHASEARNPNRGIHARGADINLDDVGLRAVRP